MARTPKQHKLAIDAMVGLADRPFSGWEIQRRTGLSRMTVSRVMSRLHAMGLLVYAPGGTHTPWSSKTQEWLRGPDHIYLLYEKYARSEKP